MLKNLLAAVFLCLPLQAVAQDRSEVDRDAAVAVLTAKASTFPKFTRALAGVQAHDPLIKKVEFVRQPGIGHGPAFALPNGTIQIDISFLEQPKPNFDDNRLIVVLFHELGHLHYYSTIPRKDWTPENSEKAAFEYSLLRTKQMAEAGDCGPLASAVKFMKLRSQGNNLDDAHVRALKRMVNGPMYAGYVDYVKAHCNVAPAASVPVLVP